MLTMAWNRSRVDVEGRAFLGGLCGCESQGRKEKRVSGGALRVSASSLTVISTS